MSLRPVTLAASSLLSPLAVVALAAPALAVCDAYSGTCTEPTEVLSETLTNTPPAVDAVVTSSVPGSAPSAVVPVRGATGPATLPFTGGELALITALGAGAVAGGTALVVAGRRRATDAA